MRLEQLLDYIGWTFLIATCVLLRLAERMFDTIIRSNSFLIEYSLYGLFVSAALLFLLYKANPGYFRSAQEKRASAIMGYFLGSVALFVFGAAAYNLETAQAHPRTRKAFVVEKSQNVRYRTPYLTLVVGNRTERFQPLRTEWEKIAEHDTVLLTVGQGMLGYEHILTFSPHTGTLTDDKHGGR